MKWPTFTLDKVTNVSGGSTPRRDRAEYWNGDIPWATPTDLPMPGEGIADVYDTADHITDAGLRSCAATLVPAGTVLYSSRATIGKLGIARVPLATNQGFANFTPKPGVNSEYLAYVLQYYTPEIASLAGSTTFKEVRRGALKTYKLPLPPPSEQRRIVKILNQADALRKKHAEADAKAARILPALFYKMFGDPAHWEANRSTELLGKLVDSQGGGTPSKQNPDYWGGDIPWVSPKDMKRDFIHDSEDHITQLALEETNSCMVPVNSILVVVRGMILARYVPLAVNVQPVTINQDMKALTVTDERVSPLFLFAALKALGRRLHSSVGTAAHGTRKLDTDRLLSLPILIPESEKHVDFLARFKELRKLDEKRAETAPRLERIFDVLLHRAFTGDLTAKWREANMKELYAEMEAQAKMIREASNTSAS